MSRRPRAGAAATSRLSIRVTDAEAAQLELLAARAGVSTADLVRSWLQREREATDYVDARPGPAEPGWYPAPRNARHVYTLHHVPGRAEPLCVRRRTLGRCDSYEVEFARGRVAHAWGEDLDDTGQALTDGRCHQDDDDDMRELDGRVFYPLEPRFRVYLDPPSPAQRQAWKTTHVVEQDLMRRLRRDGFVSVWRVRAPEAPGPALATKRRAFRPKWPERRGDLRVVDEAREQAQYFENGSHLDELNLFDLAAKGECWFNLSGVDNFHQPYESFVYFAYEPTPAELDEIGRSPWANTVRAWRSMREGARRAEAGRAANVPESVLEALAVLGLSWPCTVDDVNRAKRRAARDHHPDRGGDEAKMKRAMVAADAVMKWLERRAA